MKTNTSIFALPNGETFTYEAKTWDEILDEKAKIPMTIISPYQNDIAISPLL